MLCKFDRDSNVCNKISIIAIKMNNRMHDDKPLWNVLGTPINDP